MPEPEQGTDVYTYKYLVNPLAEKICFMNPNTITALNMLLTPITAYGLYYNWETNTLILLVLLRQYIDCLDGAVARKCNKSSKFGADLDLTSDSMYSAAINMTFLYILYINNNPYKYHAFIFFSLYLILQKHNFTITNEIDTITHDNLLLVSTITMYIMKEIIAIQ